MKKTVYNIIVAALIVALMFIISMSAIVSGYTPEPIATPQAPATTQADHLSTWKQSVTAEYVKHNIVYKGGATK